MRVGLWLEVGAWHVASRPATAATEGAAYGSLSLRARRRGGSEAQRSTDGEGAGVFVEGRIVTTGDLELVQFGDQLQVVVDVVEQRDATGFVVAAEPRPLPSSLVLP